MKDETVENLIGSWQSLHDLTSPSKIRLELTEPDLMLTELSVLSGRQEYWELFVCLLAYAEHASRDYNDVLKTLAGETESAEEADDTAGFRTYWNRFSTLPTEAITPTAVTIARSVARNGLSIGPNRMA